MRAEELERWLGRLLTTYRERILPVAAAIAEEWGRVNVSTQPLPAVDGLIAATVKVHRLVLVTRNVVGVARVGITFVNPFEPA
jgi:toxin FitB